VDAARHEVVARAFRRRLGQHGRLDLDEALLVEVRAQRHRDAVPQDQVLLHARPPQVEVAVAQARLLGHRRLVGDRERRRLRLVEDADLACGHLDLARGELRVDRLGGAPLDAAEDGDDVLGPDAAGDLEDAARTGARHDLGEPVAVAQVEEDERPEIPHPVDPAEEHDVAPDILRPERAARVGPAQIAQRLPHPGRHRPSAAPPSSSGPTVTPAGPTDRSPAVAGPAAPPTARSRSSSSLRGTRVWVLVAMSRSVTSPRASSSPPTMTVVAAPRRSARRSWARRLRPS
jgi:hypothetical protein